MANLTDLVNTIVLLCLKDFCYTFLHTKIFLLNWNRTFCKCVMENGEDLFQFIYFRVFTCKITVCTGISCALKENISSGQKCSPSWDWSNMGNLVYMHVFCFVLFFPHHSHQCESSKLSSPVRLCERVQPSVWVHLCPYLRVGNLKSKSKSLDQGSQSLLVCKLFMKWPNQNNKTYNNIYLFIYTGQVNVMFTLRNSMNW